MFLNFIPFRQEVRTVGSLSELIQMTFENEKDSLSHRNYPLPALLKDLETDRIFDTIFNYTNFKKYKDLSTPENGMKLLNDIKWFEHTDFDLLVNVGYDVENVLTITFNANGKKISKDTLERYKSIYANVFERMSANEDSTIDNFLTYEVI
ncbi:hypothetical protein KQI21_06060 [Virgibacillus proomii]|nr:hypothetical protein [Virgibacillus proomii]